MGEDIEGDNNETICELVEKGTWGSGRGASLLCFETRDEAVSNSLRCREAAVSIFVLALVTPLIAGHGSEDASDSNSRVRRSRDRLFRGLIHDKLREGSSEEVDESC